MEYKIDHQGFANHAVQIASPNFDARVNNTETVSAGITLIVIHNISLPPQQYGGNGIIELFTNQLNPNDHPYYA